MNNSVNLDIHGPKKEGIILYLPKNESVTKTKDILNHGSYKNSGSTIHGAYSGEIHIDRDEGSPKAIDNFIDPVTGGKGPPVTVPIDKLG